MGNYNYQYQNYYKYMAHNKKLNIPHVKQKDQKLKQNEFTYKKLIKKLVYQTMGVLILSAFLIGCKLIVTPETKFISCYSKRILNESFNYKIAWKQIQKIKLNDVEKYSVDVINKVNKDLNQIKIF